MSDDIEIKGRVSIDTGDSAVKLDGVKNAMKGAGSEGAASGAMFSKLKGELGGISGPASQAAGSLGGLNTALNVLKANPIIGIFVLIASLIVALFSHFMKMEKVSDSLGKAWASLSGIFEFFMNKILEPLIDMFVTLVGWITKAAEFIVGLFSPAAAEASKRLGELEEKMDDLNDVEAKNNITRAESNRKLQEMRDAANDANIPIKDRIKALQEAAKIEKETLAESIKINEERARIVLEKIAIELDVRDELIAKIREGSAAELKAARDEIYAMDEVDKEKLKKFDEYIITADDKGAELAKIDKKTNSQLRSLQEEDEKKKAEIAKEWAEKRKAAAEKAAAARKAKIANDRAFEDKELKKRQEIELSYMKDAQEKELTVLMNGYQAEIAANKRALEEKKLTRKQYFTLMSADLELFQQKEAAINKKFKDDADKKAEADRLDKKKKADERKAQDAKQAAADLKIMQKLALDKINFQIANNTKDLNLTKKLLTDKKNEITKQYVWEVLSGKNNKAELLALEQRHIEDMAGIQQAKDQIKKQEVASTQSQVAAVGDLLAQAAEVAGKHTVAGKALAVASTAINTYQAAMGAFRGMVSTIPGPVGIALGVVAAGLAAAVGIANIKKIVSTQIPGQGGGGGSVPSAAAVPAPVSPQRTSTQLNAASIQGIGNAAAGGVNRSFVLDADINNNRERASRINRAARLG